jgi:hypothetical protein
MRISNFNAPIAQPTDTSGPFSFDRGTPFELKAELAKQINRPRKVIYVKEQALDETLKPTAKAAQRSSHKLPGRR